MYGALAFLLLILGLFTLLHTSWFKRYARDFVVRQSHGILEGELSIGELYGDFFSGLVLTDVVIRQDGQTPVQIQRLEVHYSIWQVARNNAIAIDRLKVSGLTMSIARLPSGGLNITSLFKKRPPSGKPRRTIDIHEIQLVDADLTFHDAWGPSWMHLPRHITKLTSTLGLFWQEGRFSFPIRELRAEAADPQLSVQSFAGKVGIDNDGWNIENGKFRSAGTTVTVSASFKKSGYDVSAQAPAFDFPEMARLVPGLKSIDVSAVLQLVMRGPQDALNTHVVARSDGGDAIADVVLDSTVPGWRGKGRADLSRFDISQWLPTDTKSNLTGVGDFDLLLGIGHHFPRGSFTFVGPRVVYAGYEARDVRARGTLIVDRVMVTNATGVAYGSPVRATGWIDIPEPYGFHLTGRATNLDLRRLPATVPVPHMRSSLTFDYDATGRFAHPMIMGNAAFEDSTYLDARIAAGARGTIDTSGRLVTYSGLGKVDNLDIGQVGQEFEVATLRDPQFAGKVGGRFNLTGTGTTLDDLTIDVKGNNVEAAIFGGRVQDAELDLQIRNDSLAGKGSGRFENIDSAILTADPHLDGTLNGTFSLGGSIPGLFNTGFNEDLSVLSGSVDLASFRFKGIDVESASVAGELDHGLASISHADAKTSIGRATGKGRLSLSRGDSDFNYEIDIVDASLLKDFIPLSLQGSGTFSGRAVGPFDHTVIDGSVTASDLDIAGVKALIASGTYHLEGTPSNLAAMTASGAATASFVTAFGQDFGSASGKLSYSQERLQGDIEAHLPDSRIARVSGNVVIHPEHNELHVSALQIEYAKQRWMLSSTAGSPVVSWSGTTLSARDLVFDTGTGAPGRLSIEGELGRSTAAGELTLRARDVPIADLPPLFPSITGYRGQLNGTVTISGTVSEPGISADLTLSNGGVRQFAFQSLSAKGRWDGDVITGDVRLDQSPGIWFTASGSVPIDLFSNTASKTPVDVALRSSPIELALLEGLTTSVRNVAGTLQLDMTAKGPADNPVLDGFADVKGASFEVPTTGARYRNGSAHITLSPSAINVANVHLEDSRGNPVELTGTAATTSELKLGDLGFEISATQFEVLRNELGTLGVNGVLTISGRLPDLLVSGDIAVDRGTLDAAEILLRMQRPYATITPQTAAPADTGGAIAALPVPALPAIWDHLQLRLRVHASNNLIVRGDNMRLSRESLADIGDINAVFGGDLSIRKEPHRRMELSGTLQAVRGTYAFQGRRFTIERGATLRFPGGPSLDPLLGITATRTVSGVVIRAVLRGSASAPELELTSSPPLEQSDILSLLLFNRPANELAAGQRNELAVQAATLASGFVVSPAFSELAERLGLDFLQLEPTTSGNSAAFRLSAGREIWRGLFVTYSREFSSDPYNEVFIEYELNQYLRLRASGSDAPGARTRESLFRRVERFGVDVLFFFSY
jgi:autotransporter translocation and assembly factor TamB